MPQKTAAHIALGQKGEQLATEYLSSKGYEILERNWRSGRIEVDIIARIGNDWVFTEVKTRTTDYFGFPEEAVGKPKQKQLQKAAEEYLQQKGLVVDVRFDIISIIITANKTETYHFEDAFWPMEI